MTRKYIPLRFLEIYDPLHKWIDGKLWVDEAKDGQSTEKHLAGIEYIKSVLAKGQKVRPILARDNGDGTYTRLDGFKRCIAHLESGEEFIEAFVCTQDEYDRAEIFPYGDYELRAFHGGQEKEHFGLFEGDEKENFDYDAVKFLYKSPDHAGLRIELCENIQVHWGEYGRYRLSMGRKDFEALALAVSSIWEK